VYGQGRGSRSSGVKGHIKFRTVLIDLKVRESNHGDTASLKQVYRKTSLKGHIKFQFAPKPLNKGDRLL